jgi:hypothetical protein
MLTRPIKACVPSLSRMQVDTQQKTPSRTSGPGPVLLDLIVAMQKFDVFLHDLFSIVVSEQQMTSVERF